MHDAAMSSARLDRKRKWAEYMRTLECTGGRASRKEKCPDDIKQKMLTLTDRQGYFGLWMEKGSWAKVKVFEEHSRLESNTNDHMKSWLTESQLMDLYKDEEIVQELKQSKQADPKTWRCHPELPHVRKAIQYHCIISDSQKKSIEDILKKGMRMDSAEIDGDEVGVLLVNQQLSRTALALGHSSPSNEHDHARQALDNLKEEEEKKARAAAEAEKKRVVKKEATKAALEMRKATPEFKGQAWLKTLQTCILNARDESKKANGDCGLKGTIAKEFELTFQKDEGALSECHDALQRALKAENNEGLKDGVQKADRVVNNFKWDQKAFTSATRALLKRKTWE